MARRQQQITAMQPVQPREAVLYGRVSSAEQEEGFSLDAQLRFARDYAASKGMPIAEVYLEARSAKKAGRKKFMAMCEALKRAKKPMALIVEKTDRLTRNFHDVVALDDLMNNHDVEIHFFKEGRVLSRNSGSQDKLVFGIMAVLAKGYVDNLSEESRKGMGEKAAQGHWPSTAPVGYMNNPTTRLIDLDPQRAPIVRRLFEMYATGQHSINDLVVFARQEGIATTDAGRGSVTKTTINRILKSSFYHGVFTWKGQQYVGMHTPIISKELFDKAQAVMEGRTGGDYQERNFAFTGMLTCGDCGCAITAEVKTKKSGKEYIYYHCTGNKPPCNGKGYKRPYFNEKDLDVMLAKAVEALRLDDRVHQTLKAAVKSSMTAEKEYHDAAVARLRGDETRLQNRLRQLVVEKLDGNIDGEMFADLKAGFEKDLAGVRAKLAAHQRADHAFLDHGLRLIELAQSAYGLYLQRSPHERRKLLNFVCSNFILTEEAAKPVYRKPFDLLAFAGTLMQKGEGPDPSDPTPCTVEYPQRDSNPCYHRERVVS